MVNEAPEAPAVKTKDRYILRVPRGLTDSDLKADDCKLLKRLYLWHHQIKAEDWELIKLYCAPDSKSTALFLIVAKEKMIDAVTKARKQHAELLKVN